MDSGLQAKQPGYLRAHEKGFHLGIRASAWKMSLSIDQETNYPDMAQCIGEITLGENCRKSMKDVERRRTEAQMVSQMVCALLNSGGGVVKAHIKNSNYNFTRDGIGLDLENSFVNILPFPQKYLYYRQDRNDFLIFVKPWITDIFGQGICTLKTNIYLRSFSSLYELKGPDAMQFLKVRKNSILKSCSRQRLPGKLDSDELQCKSKTLTTFFNKKVLTDEETLCFTKSKHAELKMCPEKNIKEYILQVLPKTVSAFANTDGGYLFIGLDWKNHQITGFKVEGSKRELKKEIKKCIRKLPVVHFCEEKQKIKYTCRFIQVQGVGSYVCALRVERFCCVVFAAKPDSWHMEKSRKKTLTFTSQEWVKLQMDAIPGFVSQGKNKWILLSRISPLNPCSWIVYDIPEGQPQSDRLPVVSRKVICSPEVLCTELFSELERYEQLLWTELDSLHQRKLVISKSWACNVSFQENREVVLNVLYISQYGLLTLHSIGWADEELEGDSSVLREQATKLKNYFKEMALTLKQMLVSLCGYTGRTGIAIKIACVGHRAVYRYDSRLIISYPCYPRNYDLTTRTARNLEKALAKVLRTVYQGESVVTDLLLIF